MSSSIQLGTLLGKDTSRGCFASQLCPTCAYRQEVDYKGFNEVIRDILVSYHQSGMQGASMIDPSPSTTLTLMINTLLPYVENKALKRVMNLMNNINKILT